MDGDQYYSVRMRASKNEPDEHSQKHISGGELLSTYDNIKEAVNILLEKALNHSKGKPDFMQVQFEAIAEPIECVKPLRVGTNEVESKEMGHVVAKRLLKEAGVSNKVIEKAYKQIHEYSGLRGAVLVDVHTGERIDNRNDKGVRVSRMDWMDDHFRKWSDYYEMPQSTRLKEALVLATKVSHHPATIAELCWSDDPDYVTGYVSSKTLGYQRITQLKEYGDESGCRIFFVNCTRELDSYIHYLEKQPVFIQWEGENEL